MSKMIKILGAGPAGLTAGINLAKEGYKVTIFEKNKTCGERFNGDFQGLENWSEKTDVLKDLKSMDIETNFYCKPFKKLNVYDYKLNKTILNSKNPFFYLVKRGVSKDSLDQGLMKQALVVGVKIKFNKLVKESDCQIISKGPFYTNIIVKGITFTTKMKDNNFIILDDNIAPKGYAYLLISNGHGCLATVLFRHFQMIENYYKKMRKKINKIINLNISNIKEFSGYGNFFLEDKYVYEGRIHIGEGAGLQDFLGGFGMRYAITSGYLAAKSIIEDKHFDNLIRKRFYSQLETSVTNRFLYELLGNKGYQFLIRMARNYKDPREFLYNFYNTSLPKRILLPFTKFKISRRIFKYNLSL